jgi:hypothetical protein
MSRRWTLPELKLDAAIRDHIEAQRARWEAEDVRHGHPPSRRLRDDRWMWETMIEETEWDHFYGPEADA